MRQSLRGSRHCRADGFDHRGVAGHERADRSLPQSDPGGRMNIALAPQPSVALDPITVEVIGASLSSIVEETGEALIRASYSTNIKERRDCSTALFNVQGQTLCQAEHIPIHLGSFIGIVPQIL